MPLDPSIIGSFRPPEVMSPVNAMAQMYQLRALQGESEKNQLAMEKSRREMEREQTVNRLMSAAGGNQQDFLRGLERSNLGSMVPDYKEKFAKADKVSFEADQERTKSAVAALGAAKSVLPNVRSLGDAETWVTGLYSNPQVKVLLDNAGFPVERSIQIARDAWANGKGPDWLADQAMGGEQIIQSLMARSVFGTTKPGIQATPPVTGEAVATGPNELRAPAVVTTDPELAGVDAQLYRAKQQGNMPLIKQLTDDRNKILDERKEPRPLTPDQKREYGIPPGEIAWFDKQGNLHVEGGVTVNVDASNRTENKYNEKLAGLIADKDVKMRESAIQGVDLAASADRIIDILRSNKVITGAGADFRLGVAKALNLAGANNAELIKNTELLNSNLATQTLASIESANLGTGQGFTNNDLKFLKQATTGEISWNKDTLADLARLARRAAEKSAEVWNKRRRKLPKESRDLIDEEDIVIPPAPVGKTKSGAPAENPDRPLTAKELEEYNNLLKNRKR